MKEKIRKALEEFFNIGDSYTYELTRVKEAFSVGTMTLDDFVEWGEEEINNLCDYLCDKLQEQKKWHLCSEGDLPTESNYYLARICNDDVGDYDYRKTWFAHEDDYFDESEWREIQAYEEVIAWMELPKFEEVE